MADSYPLMMARPTILPQTNSLDIESLMDEYYAAIHRLALSILDDGSDDGIQEADDAAQETFIAAHRALATFRGEATPKTWLTAIALNTCRGRLRKRKLRQVLTKTIGGLLSRRENRDDIEATVAQREFDRQLWAAVDALGEKHRIPVVLHYVHELTVPEIAALLGVREGTVYSRLHYARQKLMRACLSQFVEEASHES